jgi:acetolactate synthase-1/2/3 large subunit
MNGGESIARVLQSHGVEFLFTLCGGHISPILKGAKDLGIRVIDVRHEATAVFAADAVARITGIPGVAAVTAGPGATNTITAGKNAQLAQSPVILLGGAPATVLKGRGALQDIDQMALFKPHVKWAQAVTRVRDLAPSLAKAFHIARSGVPGPVFVECPVDLLYDESVIREWYAASTPQGKSLPDRAVRSYLNYQAGRLFAGADSSDIESVRQVRALAPTSDVITRAAKRIAKARRPVLIVRSLQRLMSSHEQPNELPKPGDRCSLLVARRSLNQVMRRSSRHRLNELAFRFTCRAWRAVSWANHTHCTIGTNEQKPFARPTW